MTNIQTVSMNEKWISNIYENIKKMEEYERNAREGCQNLFEYLALPMNNNILLGNAQFKNIKFLVTEFHLLLSDLSPLLNEDKLAEFRKLINTIDDSLNYQKLFLKEINNAARQLVSVKLTPLFYETLKTLSQLKINLFKEIKHILYIESKPVYDYT